MVVFGCLPELWKIGSVKALFKNQEQNESEAKLFWPICLLSVLGKVLKKLISSRLREAFTREGFTSDRQYGFWKGKFEDVVLKFRSVVRNAYRLILDYFANYLREVNWAVRGSWQVGLERARGSRLRGNCIRRRPGRCCVWQQSPTAAGTRPHRSMVQSQQVKTVGLKNRDALGKRKAEQRETTYHQNSREERSLRTSVSYLGIHFDEDLRVNAHFRPEGEIHESIQHSCEGCKIDVGTRALVHACLVQGTVRSDNHLRSRSMV